MSTTAQMEDNLSFMKDFKPLSVLEKKTIAEAQASHIVEPREVPAGKEIFEGFVEE
jgi:hypothetical protein